MNKILNFLKEIFGSKEYKDLTEPITEEVIIPKPTPIITESVIIESVTKKSVVKKPVAKKTGKKTTNKK